MNSNLPDHLSDLDNANMRLEDLVVLGKMICVMICGSIIALVACWYGVKWYLG